MSPRRSASPEVEVQLEQQEQQTSAAKAGAVLQNSEGGRCARPYEPEELRPFHVPQLCDIIRSQLDNILTPLPATLKLKRAKKQHLIDILLDSKYGFTTREPKRTYDPAHGVRVSRGRGRAGRVKASAGRAFKSSNSQIIGASSASALAPFLESSSLPFEDGLLSLPPDNDAPDFPGAFQYVQDAGSAVNIFAAEEFGPGAFAHTTGTSFDKLYTMGHQIQNLSFNIYDRREVLPEQRVLPDRVDMTVSVTSDAAGQQATAEWRDILGEIQKTASAIGGDNFKLSYSRPFDQFKRAILQVVQGISLEEASNHCPKLVVDKESFEYSLFIDSLGYGPFLPQRAQSADLAAAHQKLEALATSSTSKLLSMDEIRARGQARRVVEQDSAARDPELGRTMWLAAELRARDGYDTFNNAKNKMRDLRFESIANQWAFAIEFIDEYVVTKKYPGTDVEVSLQDTYTALKRKSTWVRVARDGLRRYRAHRDHPDVVAAINDPTCTGVEAFIGLLRGVASG
ncbi:hypothetical protein BD626DRAFT_633724 [Schizophyllum amplum]|uniref:Uncharacterized protein n=1 Tax=Schizophyllum amplum TaxID=97359 RepID=A0A550C1M2_9AGAR|nr:hypothetical protein BD626DRAFT_633724 [Auriculariopsis ampla]